MMDKFFEKIVCILEENECILNEDREVYIYVLQTVWAYGISIGLSAIIGFSMKMPVYCAIFLIAFMVLRQNAGGYHTSGWIKCCFLSCITLQITLMWIRDTLQNQADVIFVLALIMYLLIIVCAPLDDENRPLDNHEKKMIGKRARKIATIEILLGAIIFVADKKSAYAIWYAIIWTGVGFGAWFVKKAGKKEI